MANALARKLKHLLLYKLRQNNNLFLTIATKTLPAKLDSSLTTSTPRQTQVGKTSAKYSSFKLSTRNYTPPLIFRDIMTRSVLPPAVTLSELCSCGQCLYSFLSSHCYVCSTVDPTSRVLTSSKLVKVHFLSVCFQCFFLFSTIQLATTNKVQQET